MRVCGIGTPGFAVLLVLVNDKRVRYNHNTITIRYNTIYHAAARGGSEEGERERYSIIPPKPGKKVKKEPVLSYAVVVVEFSSHAEEFQAHVSE